MGAWRQVIKLHPELNPDTLQADWDQGFVPIAPLLPHNRHLNEFLRSEFRVLRPAPTRHNTNLVSTSSPHHVGSQRLRLTMERVLYRIRRQQLQSAVYKRAQESPQIN